MLLRLMAMLHILSDMPTVALQLRRVTMPAWMGLVGSPLSAFQSWLWLMVCHPRLG